MDARLQRRVQRYGWDLAASDYESLWRAQLQVAQAALLHQAALAGGERVLDVACGTGMVTIEAARAVGSSGSVDGVDLSDEMVEAARRQVLQLDTASLARHARKAIAPMHFTRMDAEALAFESGSFDVALCSLGLMYVADPAQAMRELRRVLRPGGRLVLAVWGERRLCGWSRLFEIVQDEVTSEVCPLFFQLGYPDVLAKLCADAGFEGLTSQVIDSTLNYTSPDEACRAAFTGGPVALAWSRFDGATRERVFARYLESIDPWRSSAGYAVPAQFLIVSGRVATE